MKIRRGELVTQGRSQRGRDLLSSGFAICYLLSAASCSVKTIGLKAMTPILEDTVTSFERETDIQSATDGAPALIKLLEGIIQGEPRNAKYLLMASRIEGMYTFGILEDQAEELDTDGARERVRSHNAKAKNYGMRVVDMKLPGFRSACAGGADALAAYLKTAAKKAHADALFWTGFAWAGEIQYSLDIPERVNELPLVREVMLRAKELDPTIFYGGPDLFLGVYYGGRSKMLGGNPDKAVEHFEAAKKVTAGRFLIPAVLQARFPAVQTMDQESFENLLKGVLEADPDAFPEQALANHLAQRRARRYLAKMNEWF